jgi:hypothetical protein
MLFDVYFLTNLEKLNEQLGTRRKKIVVVKKIVNSAENGIKCDKNWIVT